MNSAARADRSGTLENQSRLWIDGAGECFYPPTVPAGVRPGMRLTTEEIFGPVIAVIEFDTVDELLAMANDTPYRLAALLLHQQYGAGAAARG